MSKCSAGCRWTAPRVARIALLGQATLELLCLSLGSGLGAGAAEEAVPSLGLDYAFTVFDQAAGFAE